MSADAQIPDASQAATSPPEAPILDDGELLAALYQQSSLMAYYIISKEQKSKVDFKDLAKDINDISLIIQANMHRRMTK